MSGDFGCTDPIGDRLAGAVQDYGHHHDREANLESKADLAVLDSRDRLETESASADEA